MSLGRTLKLNNGVEIPQIGFGTWQAKPGEVERAVSEALRAGYRHIDCALVYGNQAEVAQGIKDSGVKREDIKLVSKLWNSNHAKERIEPDLDLTLSQLKTDYLDVYLIHWPAPFPYDNGNLFPKKDGKVTIDWEHPGVADTWKELVRIYKETKKVKAIGVSNFNVELLEKIINETGIVPVMNQIEAHPSLIQPELFDYCKEKNIKITAYSPLGNNTTGKPRVIDSPQVKSVADRLDKSPAQVLIAWGAKSGFFVIPKSVTPERIKSNFDDFELSDADYEEINKFGKANTVRGNTPAEYNPKWPINVFGEAVESEYKKAW